VKAADQMVPLSDSEVASQMMDAIQQAFYQVNKDVTKEEVLVDEAKRCGLDGNEFSEVLSSQSVRQSAQDDFDRSRLLTTTGFPTTVYS
jgi:predicted DsbA family dithiol-disulfide isomerase